LEQNSSQSSLRSRVSVPKMNVIEEIIGGEDEVDEIELIE